MLRQVMREGFAAPNERFDRLLALGEKKESNIQLVNCANGVGGGNQLKDKINDPHLKEDVDASIESQKLLVPMVLH
ncbi:unnamed protein product [Linum trigynum]|uniref:Uncharacterized protein n=1 Tax=Linum trigynum TaxID=586398 RepID=A0AAV2GRJ6_9ROSI